MSEHLLNEASKMFENENQWQAACKLSDLIPEIKKFWFKQFMDLLSDYAESKLEKDKRFIAFHLIPWSENGDEYCCWYIMPKMPKELKIDENDDGEPLGLSTAIEIGIEKNEFYSCFGLRYLYKKKPPALAKLDNFFKENLSKVFSDIKSDPDCKNDWNSNDWIRWENLYPRGKNSNLAEPETIYYLHKKGEEFIDIIIERILTFISKHQTALISAHTRLINNDF